MFIFFFIINYNEYYEKQSEYVTKFSYNLEAQLREYYNTIIINIETKDVIFRNCFFRFN